ncbi:hypothetical protein R3P38DRAFT_3216577 [Favolaschia claudopus]|uniref:Uncharacterized protein n=1 Tax=Favolaschia claudopus TaxID=2862362 RepID=A0AAW0A6G1_9AGAR
MTSGVLCTSEESHIPPKRHLPVIRLSADKTSPISPPLFQSISARAPAISSTSPLPFPDAPATSSDGDEYGVFALL